MYLLTGATGNAGGGVVDALVDTGVSVRALVREHASPQIPDRVEQVTGDLNDPATMTDAFDGAVGAFLLPGYADAA